MLPFFAAGGAISGSSFGLFYTILMQVGYNYYGKIVLEDIKGGMSLFDALIKVQQDIRPFSDAMMQAALDAMPDTIEKSIDAFTDIITSFGEARFKDISKSWLLPDSDDFIGPRREREPTIITDPRRRREINPIQETARERVKRVPLEQRKQEQEQREDVKRRAGQSQIIERLRLIRLIAKTGQDLSVHRTHGHTAHVADFTARLRRHQALLEDLLRRYRF